MSLKDQVRAAAQRDPGDSEGELPAMYNVNFVDSPDQHPAGRLTAAILAQDWNTVAAIAGNPHTTGEDVDTARGALAGANQPATPAASAATPTNGTRLHLTPEQYELLLRPLSGNRVKNRQGQSHLEAWDVRRYLTRIFGFGGWNAETIELAKIHERIAMPGEIKYGNGGTNAKPAYTVVYSAQVRLNIFNPDGTVGISYEDAATGDGANMPTYQAAADFGIKTALSQALKRCAVNLGDQFGLSLYNGGKIDAVVNRTLAAPADLAGVGGGAVEQMAHSDVVHSEPGTPEASDDGPELPSPLELRDEALKPQTSYRRLLDIYNVITETHPHLNVMVTNEHGDSDLLSALVKRIGAERKPANARKPTTEGDPR